MHTLFDFVTHIKGVEYIASLTFIAGYLIFSEFLKAKPFNTLLETGRDDIGHLKMEGSGRLSQTIKRVIAAPFIGLAYVAALPFAFLFALAAAVLGRIIGATGKEMSFGWRPLEAYLSGKKEDSKTKEQEKKS